MRIGIISLCKVPWGGSEELWAATALKALERGHEVLASVVGWANDPPKLRELAVRGAKILRRHNPDLRIQESFGPVSSYGDLFKSNPDVIVVNQCGSFDVLWLSELLELLSVTPIPFVVVCQCNEGLPVLTKGHSREHISNLFSRAYRVLFVSNQNRVDAERQLATGIYNSDVVLNPVNLSNRSYLTWPESGTLRLASVARLEAMWKGQDILIEALSADQWKNRDWRLTLYGSGVDEPYLRSLVEFFGLQEQITFAGHVADVRSIWAREQILVLTSRAEGTPLALVEAMLCGRPAIVSDVGGNQEWITEGKTGFVAEAPAIGLVRAALERAWISRQGWAAMGMQAHKAATAKLSDPSFRALLNVLSDSQRNGRFAEAVTAEERQRLKHYRRLIAPSLVREARRTVASGVLRLKKRLGALRAKVTESQERSLLRLAEPRKPD
jgi:L-malate glycosyltransferase